MKLTEIWFQAKETNGIQFFRAQKSAEKKREKSEREE